MELTFLTRSLKPPVSVMAQDQEDYTLAVPDSSPWGACPLLPSGDCSPVNSKSHKWLIYAYPIYRWVITHQLLTGRILWTVDTTKSISRHELWNLLRSPVAHYRQGILKKSWRLPWSLREDKLVETSQFPSWSPWFLNIYGYSIYGYLWTSGLGCYKLLWQFATLGPPLKGASVVRVLVSVLSRYLTGSPISGSAKGETSMIMLSCG